MSQIYRMFPANSTINGFIVNIKSLFDKLCGQGFNKGHLVPLFFKVNLKISISFILFMNIGKLLILRKSVELNYNYID